MQILSERISFSQISNPCYIHLSQVLTEQQQALTQKGLARSTGGTEGQVVPDSEAKEKQGEEDSSSESDSESESESR